MGVSYTAEGDAGALLTSIRDKIAKQGGQLTGDDASGTFTVAGFKGAYAVENAKLTLNVLDKPMFVPDSMILGWLRDNLG